MIENYCKIMSHCGTKLGFTPRILVVAPDCYLESYQNLLHDIDQIEVTFVEPDQQAIISSVKGHHALIACPRNMFSKEVVKSAEDTLMWVHNLGAGSKDFIIPELVYSDIVFTNGKIIQGPECADHALALLLALTRRLNLVQQGTPYNQLPRPIELRGKTAVIIGVGGIGQCIAERVKGFGMKVIGVNGDYIPMINSVDKIVPPESLHQVLAEADVVFMSAPYTDESEGVLDDKAFDVMLKKPYLVNVSRGKTIDTASLVRALESEKITACGIDVTDPEPLPDDHILRSMNNVIVTPHIAGLSDHNRERSWILMKDNIKRFAEGKPLFNIVEKKLGY